MSTNSTVDDDDDDEFRWHRDRLAMAKFSTSGFGTKFQMEVPYRIRYDTRCYFNVLSKADMSQLNLLHGPPNNTASLTCGKWQFNDGRRATGINPAGDAGDTSTNISVGGTSTGRGDWKRKYGKRKYRRMEYASTENASTNLQRW